MNEQDEIAVKKFKKLIMMFFGTMALVIVVGIVAGVVTLNVFEGQSISKGDLIIPIIGPMIVAAIVGAVPTRIAKGKMFPTKEEFEKASKLFTEQNAKK